MMVDLHPISFIRLQAFNECLHDDVNKWFEEVEKEPDVDHLDVGSLGQVVADIALWGSII